MLGILLLSSSGCMDKKNEINYSEYIVNRLTDSLTIDANWNKQQWKNVKALSITNIMGEKPKHIPKTEVKMLYDNCFIYVIFHVEEKYVKAVACKINGAIYRDSAVEFFFTPSENLKDGYYNLEVNCIGTPYFGHQTAFKTNEIKIDTNDIKQIEIAHSFLANENTEIEKLTEWTLEYKIPIEILKKYTEVIKPATNVIWRANFYKTADATSNPHYLTWNKVENKTPNFHLPKYFGKLKFN